MKKKKKIIPVISAFFVSFETFAGTAVWKSNAGGDITDAANWVGDTVPEAGDYLDFSKITTTGYTLTGAFSDDRIFAGAKFALTGNNSVSLSGSLHFQNLTNASQLAIADAGSLTVEGNLVWQRSTAKSENNIGRLLQSNGGTVTVKGVAMCNSTGRNCTGCYQTRSASTALLRVGGLDYYAGGYTIGFYLPSYGSSSGRAASEWIVGSGGMAFSAGGNASNVKNCYVVEGADSTLSSQADWAIGTSGNSQSIADIYIDGQTLTIDTKDYDDDSVSRTVTLNGRIYAPSTSGTSLKITGNGTFKVATSVTS